MERLWTVKEAQERIQSDEGADGSAGQSRLEKRLFAKGGEAGKRRAQHLSDLL